VSFWQKCKLIPTGVPPALETILVNSETRKILWRLSEMNHPLKNKIIFVMAVPIIDKVSLATVAFSLINKTNQNYHPTI
jgi:hypothetical protein